MRPRYWRCWLRPSILSRSKYSREVFSDTGSLEIRTRCPSSSVLGRRLQLRFALATGPSMYLTCLQELTLRAEKCACTGRGIFEERRNDVRLDGSRFDDEVGVMQF
jgi:hypothetical protein